MPNLTHSPAWQALSAHQTVVSKQAMRGMFRADPSRFDKFSLQLEGLLLDYSKNLITEETLALLLNLARQSKLDDWIERMFNGEKINTSEQRAVLHTALRAPRGAEVYVDGKDVMPDVHRVLDHIRRFSDAVRNNSLRGHTGKPFRDVVNIGIGGSALGPLMACEALKPYSSVQLNAHFVSNVDSTDLVETLNRLDPETTLFIVSSKAFTTQETITNADSARTWLVKHLGAEESVAKHFVAVSTNLTATSQFGINPDNVFEFWDWVGGRYSLWSAVGLPIALAAGPPAFAELLAGAAAMDEHVREAPPAQNMAVLLALIGIWNRNFLGCGSLAIVPYERRLALLPAFLQQLDMESNGKRVTRDGEPVDYPTAPVVWGGVGTNAQHAFFQALHQGPEALAVDFLVARRGAGDASHHRLLVANCLAQSEALMRGRDAGTAEAELIARGMAAGAARTLAPHLVCPGSRSSNTILFDRLDARTLGALLALYEHKVFVQGVVWRIDSFDQWGVELGKRLAGTIVGELAGGTAAAHDASTAGLIARCRSD
jgi:glucose-6-phosphate isomerase